MIVSIDFNSDEAIYMQLRNQIIFGIAADEIREGDSLPSVRQLAEDIGINMHTVNKAYAVLREEGFLKLDRRYGAVIALDIDKIRAIEDMRAEIRVILAKAICKNISEDEVHQLIHEIYQEFLR
ncbi:MAG: GntR family transcriptional regulator [Lachnospiraceae bacterium]|nr:GntR family transcriptional regulator [Lachnospiraceae bacterium]